MKKAKIFRGARKRLGALENLASVQVAIMYEIHVEVADEKETEYTFTGRNKLKKYITVERDPTTKKFPTIDAFFKVRRPEYKTLYNGWIGDGETIREYINWEYNEDNEIVYYTGEIAFDVNKYGTFEKSNKMRIIVYLE